jgi:hypothetical protein
MNQISQNEMNMILKDLDGPVCNMLLCLYTIIFEQKIQDNKDVLDTYNYIITEKPKFYEILKQKLYITTVFNCLKSIEEKNQSQSIRFSNIREKIKREFGWDTDTDKDTD